MPRIPFTPYPLALLAAAFAVGVLAAHLISISPMLLICCAVLSFSFVIGSLSSRHNYNPSIMVVLVAVISGSTLATVERRNASGDRIKQLFEAGRIADGDPVEVTGVMDGPPETAPDGLYLQLRVEQIRIRNDERNASGVVEFLAPIHDRATRAEFEDLELQYGARLRVMTPLERTDNYRNPGVSSFTEYLERKGYDATGVIKSPLLVERLDDRRVFLPLAWLYQWHQQLEAQIKARFSDDTAGVLDAALLGNRRYLSHATAERFRQGGTFHILVINGLHISFIGLLVLLIVRRVIRKRSWQFVISSIVLWSYALAVGAQSAVVRASLMFTFVALAPLLARRANSLNALGGAALVLLVWRPGELFDPSFQLTFLSVLAIVVIAGPLMLKLSLIGAWRPTRATPSPPICARWLRALCEALFWSECEWQAEMARSNHSYRLFKTPVAARFERFHLQRPLRYALGAVVISASVQIGMLPLLIIYFHRISPAALVLNIVVGVLMAVLGIVALAALLISNLSLAAAAPVIGLANAVDWLLVHTVDLFTPLGGASLRLPEYTGWSATIYVIYFLPLLVLALALARWQPLDRARECPSPQNTRWRKVSIVAAALQSVLLLLLVFHPLSAGHADGKLRVDFLDVGQGDAALVTMPDGTTLLIDGGGRTGFQGRNAAAKAADPESDDEQPFDRDTRSIGEAVVSEYLWWRGLDRVDFLLATHADADHIDGLNDVARNFNVRAALVARTPRDDPEYAKFAATLVARQIPFQVIGAGDQLQFGGTTATILWPPLTNESAAPSANNDSIVLRLQFGERTILMTGDVEKEGEAAILNARDLLVSDVVKVPHHGSKTSSTAAFVAGTHPRLAVISVGLTSVFGHPHKEVVERWLSSGAEVMTTGKRGTITVTTDGKTLSVESFVREGKSGVRSRESGVVHTLALGTGISQISCEVVADSRLQTLTLTPSDSSGV